MKYSIRRSRAVCETKMSLWQFLVLNLQYFLFKHYLLISVAPLTFRTHAMPITHFIQMCWCFSSCLLSFLPQGLWPEKTSNPETSFFQISQSLSPPHSESYTYSRLLTWSSTIHIWVFHVTFFRRQSFQWRGDITWRIQWGCYGTP